MDQLELFGAPRAWLWLVLAGTALGIPALVRGFARRGRGPRHERGFWLQRAPQLAAGVNLFVVSCGFEAIELVLGTGEPAFAKGAFRASREVLPLLTLAIVLPAPLAGSIAWVGVLISAGGLALLVSGWLALGSSFSPDAEIVRGQQVRQSGPYRFVLHPVYAGLVVFLLGSAVTALSPLAALVTLCVVSPLFLRRAKYEEALLVDELGEAYLAYARRLGWRRLIPVLGPLARDGARETR
jgi:protein-S-isoprenylcysteine O-methyltransferase Ste14